MKKFVCILLSMLLVMSCLAACGSGSTDTTTAPSTAAANTPSQEAADTQDKGFEKLVVGVVMMSASDTMMEMQTYMNEVIGPRYNMEFIYSEVISDAGAMTTFIENAKASGAQAIINTLSNMGEQAAATCEDLGLWLVNNTSTYSESVASFSRLVGVVGASPSANGQAFSEAMRSVLSAEEPSNVLILSGAACFGAISQVEATTAMLTTVQELYGLTYSQDLKELATVNATTEVDTGSDIKVTIHPGVAQGADYASAVSSLLQTGDYNVVCSAFDAYGALSVAIDEVEKALNMDIKVISQMAVNETARGNLEALDSTGDNCINAGVTAGNTNAVAICALLLRNAFDGYSEVLRPDGKACQLVTAPLVVKGAEDMAKLMNVPVSYISEEELDSLVLALNPDCTVATFEELLSSLTTENILSKFSA